MEDLLDTNSINFKNDSNNLHIRQTESKVINDLDINNYNKKNITYISIDSRDRDNINTLPNNYNINLNNKFNNIESIQLEQIQLPYTNTPINKNNNKIRWSYATRSQYTESRCQKLKFKTGGVVDYSLYFYVHSDDKKIYEAEVNAGFYDTESLANELMDKMNSIIITNIYKNDKTPSGDNITDDTEILAGDTIAKVADKGHNFYVDINPITNKVLFINRLENFIPVTIETLLFNVDTVDSTNKDNLSLTIDDTLGYLFSFNTPPPSPSTKDAKFSKSSVYFTLPVMPISCVIPDIVNPVGIHTGISTWEVYNQQLEDFRSGNTGLPIVPTNFPSIGGFPAELINNKEYYHVNFTPPDWKDGTYEFVDVLTYFTGQEAGSNTFKISTDITKVFLYRFRLNIVRNEKEIKCRFRELFILNDKIEYAKYHVAKTGPDFILTKNMLISEDLLFSQVIGENLPESIASKKLPRIGRSMPFKFETDEPSILDILTWPIPTCGMIAISEKCSYRGIQYNTDSYLTNKIDYYSLGIINKSILNLNVELLTSGVYVFRGPRYVFLKIIFPNKGQLDTTLSKTVGKNINSLNIENNYNLFNKIILPVIPGTLKNNNFVDNIFYSIDQVLDNIDSLIIQFINSDGSLVDMKTEHNFTLKIVERDNILKNTLLNTHTNQINTVGTNYIVSNNNF